MDLSTEIKRKVFHHLSLLYLLIYALLPSKLTLWILGIGLALESAVEFLRIRRPELNAWFLGKFGGIHRPSEILQPSGIFWTLLGCWGTMVVFANKRIVIVALGFLVFGDTAAALVGKKWGRRPWPHNPPKTIAGSAGFFAVCALWAFPIIYWPAAILSSAATAWLESRALPWNDNFWLPLLGGLCVSIFNLLLGGRHGGAWPHASNGFFIAYALAMAGVLNLLSTLLARHHEK